ncbi:MAG: metallophosphoesterase [Phycisphaerales bacterium]|nr:metallophosphoesterase [Phycisphaerales bacterium]
MDHRISLRIGMSDLGFWPVLIGSTVADACVVFVMLFVRRRSEHVMLGPPLITMYRVAFTAVVALAAFLLKLVVWTAIGVNFFGWVNLVYVDLMVLMPLVGAVVLFLGRRRQRRVPRVRLSLSVRLLAIALLGLAPLGFYSTFVEPFRLQLETAVVPVAGSRNGSDVIRIGVLADIQTADVSDYERDAVDRIMELKPDIILLPGDLFQGSLDAFNAQFETLVDLVSRLSAPGGVYFVMGDCDYRDRIERLFRETDVTLLHNDVVRVAVGDRDVTIGGLELEYTSTARAAVRRLLDVPGDGDIRILLAHRPDIVSKLPNGSKIDLVVAGHTHGGQVVIPFLGPPITFSKLPMAVAAGGIHWYQGNMIYISRGVGCERGQAPRVRFLCPPEMTLLHLKDGEGI